LNTTLDDLFNSLINIPLKTWNGFTNRMWINIIGVGSTQGTANRFMSIKLVPLSAKTPSNIEGQRITLPDCHKASNRVTVIVADILYDQVLGHGFSPS
jgi:hypothetical protein